jgi:DNA-binding CsgD family transcriptional regulator
MAIVAFLPLRTVDGLPPVPRAPGPGVEVVGLSPEEHAPSVSSGSPDRTERRGTGSACWSLADVLIMRSVDRSADARRRVLQDLELAMTQTRGVEDLYARLVGSLTAASEVTGACWHVTDPVSGVPTAGGRVGSPPGDFARSLEFEFLRPDFSRLAEVMRRPRPMAILSEETGGVPDRSARFREMIAPEGSADELRVAWVDRYGIWGALTLFSASRFDSSDVALLTRAVPAFARALRLARAGGKVAKADRRRPGIVLVDERGRVRGGDAEAGDLLAELGRASGRHLGETLTVLAALARRRDPSRPATADVHDSTGRWFTLDALAIDGAAPAIVAIVVQPARPESVLDAILRAHGMSQRERQVAQLAVSGRSNREIAALLSLSVWTVQDHLKSIYAKTGVVGRGELAAHVVGAVSSSPRPP